MDQTLGVLLDAWRETKNPALASLIGQYSVASETPAGQALRSKPKVSQAEWLAALRDGDLVDRTAVLARLTEGTSGKVADRLSELAELDADPRVVDALHALIEAVPWTSTGARKVWTRAFRLLESLADPRTIELARSFDANRIQVWSETFGPWMAERLSKIADGLEALPEAKPIPAGAVAELVAKLERRVEAQASNQPPDPIPGLLQAAMLAPEDLDARLVLADALSDRGDPRGELIRVQIARETAPTDRELAAREKQLLKDHHEHLLGSLAAFTRKKGLEFERGFVSACVLEPMIHTNLLEAALADERLATIRKVRAPLAFVLAPGLRSLREVDVIPNYEESLRPVFRADRALPFAALSGRIHPGDHVLLDDCSCLPDLDRLALSGYTADLRRAGASQLGRRVTSLHFDDPQVDGLADLFALARSRGRGTVSVANGEAEAVTWRSVLALTRTDAGLAATLTVTLAASESPRSLARVFAYIGAQVGAIRRLGVTGLEVRASKAIRDEAIRAQLREAVTAQLADLERVEFVGPLAA